MERALLYVRVSRVNKEWVEACSAEAGMSAAAGVDAILTEARARNWTLRAQPAQVVQP